MARARPTLRRTAAEKFGGRAGASRPGESTGLTRNGLRRRPRRDCYSRKRRAFPSRQLPKMASPVRSARSLSALEKIADRRSKDLVNAQTPFMRSAAISRTNEEEPPKDELKRKLAFEEVTNAENKRMFAMQSVSLLFFACKIIDNPLCCPG